MTLLDRIIPPDALRWGRLTNVWPGALVLRGDKWSMPLRPGGMFTAQRPGAESRALLRDGERVIPLHGRASGSCRTTHEAKRVVCEHRGHHLYRPIDGMAMHRCDPCGLIQFDDHWVEWNDGLDHDQVDPDPPESATITVGPDCSEDRLWNVNRIATMCGICGERFVIPDPHVCREDRP